MERRICPITEILWKKTVSHAKFNWIGQSAAALWPKNDF